MIYVLLVSTFFTAETAEVRTLGLVATPSVPPPCPVYCTCPPVAAGHLTIDACSRDPTGDLGPLLLSHKDISTLPSFHAANRSLQADKSYSLEPPRQ